MFDAHRFLLTEIGAPQSVAVLFSSYNLPAPNDDAVRKWYGRNSIPSDWFALLLCVLELDRGQPVKLANYVGSANVRTGTHA